MPGPCCSPWPPASVLRASWPSTYPADDGGGDAGSVAVPTETQARGQDPHWRRQGHHSHAGHRDFRNPGRYRERSSQTAGLTMVARASRPVMTLAEPTYPPTPSRRRSPLPTFQPVHPLCRQPDHPAAPPRVPGQLHNLILRQPALPGYPQDPRRPRLRCSLRAM